MLLHNSVAIGIVIIPGNSLTALISLKHFSLRIEEIVTVDTIFIINSVFTIDRAFPQNHGKAEE